MRHLVGLLALLAMAVNMTSAQTPTKPRTPPAPATKKMPTAPAKAVAPRMISVTVTTDVNCSFAVDGKPQAVLRAGEPAKVPLSARAHKLEATSTSEVQDRWEGTLDLTKVGVKPVVEVQLLPIQAKRIAAERIARESRIAEEESRPPIEPPAHAQSQDSQQRVAKQPPDGRGFSGTWKVTQYDGKPPKDNTVYEVEVKGDTLNITKLFDNKSKTTKWTIDGVGRRSHEDEFDITLTARWDDTVIETKQVIDGLGMMMITTQRWSLSGEGNSMNIALTVANGNGVTLLSGIETAERTPTASSDSAK